MGLWVACSLQATCVSRFNYCTLFSAHTQSAGTFEDMQETSGTNYQRTRASSGTAGGAKNMASRFNAMAKAGEEEARQRAEEERQRRQAREQAEREKNAREEERRQEEIAKQHAAMPVSLLTRLFACWYTLIISSCYVCICFDLLTSQV